MKEMTMEQTVTEDAVLAAFWQGDTDCRTLADYAPPTGDATLAAVYREGWKFAYNTHAVPTRTLELLASFTQARTEGGAS